MVTTTRFALDETQDAYLSELDGTNAVQAVYTNEPQHYGGVVAQRRDSDTSVLHVDALGFTRLLTDVTEAATDTYLGPASGSVITDAAAVIVG